CAILKVLRGMGQVPAVIFNPRFSDLKGAFAIACLAREPKIQKRPVDDSAEHKKQQSHPDEDDNQQLAFGVVLIHSMLSFRLRSEICVVYVAGIGERAPFLSMISVTLTRRTESRSMGLESGAVVPS